MFDDTTKNLQREIKLLQDENASLTIENETLKVAVARIEAES